MIYTFACLVCSALYAIVYATICFGKYRTPFLVATGIATFLVLVLYFYMNRKKKKGPWDSLGNVFIVLIMLAVISFIIVLVVGIHATAYLDASGLSFNDWSDIIKDVYSISPVFVLILNVANIFILFCYRKIES